MEYLIIFNQVTKNCLFRHDKTGLVPYNKHALKCMPANKLYKSEYLNV